MRIRRTKRLNIKRSGPTWWSVHTHSRYSNNDALPSVKSMVAKAVALGQPALGLTDHGNMAGSVELYTECMKAGIKPFPGSELYFVPDIEQHKRDYANKHVKAQRYHLGVVAYDSLAPLLLIGWAEVGPWFLRQFQLAAASASSIPGPAGG